jgi:hypothetical protein
MQLPPRFSRAKALETLAEFFARKPRHKPSVTREILDPAGVDEDEEGFEPEEEMVVDEPEPPPVSDDGTLATLVSVVPDKHHKTTWITLFHKARENWVLLCREWKGHLEKAHEGTKSEVLLKLALSFLIS